MADETSYQAKAGCRVCCESGRVGASVRRCHAGRALAELGSGCGDGQQQFRGGARGRGCEQPWLGSPFSTGVKVLVVNSNRWPWRTSPTRGIGGGRRAQDSPLWLTPERKGLYAEGTIIPLPLPVPHGLCFPALLHADLAVTEDIHFRALRTQVAGALTRTHVPTHLEPIEDPKAWDDQGFRWPVVGTLAAASPGESLQGTPRRIG